MTERQVAALRAAVALEDSGETRYRYGLSALDIAVKAGIDGTRRHGNGAVKGSWSGYTSEAFAVASTLTSLVKRGYLNSWWDDTYEVRNHRKYATTNAGLKALAEHDHQQAWEALP